MRDLRARSQVSIDAISRLERGGAGFSPEPSATCVWPSKPLAWISEMAKCGCAELPKRPEEPRPLLQAHLWGGPTALLWSQAPEGSMSVGLG